MDTNGPDDVTPNLDNLIANLVPNDEVSDVDESLPKLSEFELSFVTFMHQMYSLEGTVMSEAQAELLLKIPLKQYRSLMKAPNVLAALKERGVTDRAPVGVESDAVANLAFQALSPQQLVVANAMLDLIDTRSQKKKLQDYGVSTQTYNTWLKDSVFKNYMLTRAESMLGENQHEAHLALLDKVRMGDMKALELYYEMRGIYTRVGAAGVNAQAIGVDIQNLLVNIIEIINDEVDDPSVSARIADKFKSLMTARTIAGELVESTIGLDGTMLHQPTIAPARVMTPELEHLMERGEGYE